MIGLLFSKAAMSIGMITVIACAIINPDIKSAFSKFKKDKVAIGLTSIFFIYLLSGIYSDDCSYYFTRIRIKLPFLLLPFSFIAIKPFPKKHLDGLLLAFLTIIFSYSVWSFTIYLQDFEHINKSYLSAKVIPVCISHIRFSLMVAISIFIGVYLYYQSPLLKTSKFFKITLIFVTLFLIFFLHILAVRSGLIAFYLAAIAVAIRSAILFKKYFLGLTIISIIFLLPILSYHIFPTFKNKLRYTMYDISSYQEDNFKNLSDSRRITSVKGGIAIAAQNPIWGVGAGDIQTEMNVFYDRYYPELTTKDRLIPHNQFIYILATTGVIGLAIFVIAIFLTLIDNRFNSLVFLSASIIMISSFFSEATLEVQIGTALYMLFTGLALNQKGLPSQEAL